MEPISQVKMKALTDTYLESLLTDLPSEAEIAEQQQLSRRFLLRMDKLIGRHHRKPRTWKKMLLVAAIISAILATAVSVYAYREVIEAFFINVYEKYSEIIFPSSATEPGNSLTDNLPSNIPSGYRETSRLTLIGLLQITYTNDAGDILLFEKMEQGSQHIGINTEGIKVEEMTVNGHQAIYYSNLGQNNLIWADGAYIYTITGTITKEEIIDLANSTN